MNCYLCRIEAHCSSHPALALCQQCGVGICEEHLVELFVRPIVGLAGDNRTLPRYTFICCRCYRSAVSPTRPASSQEQTSRIKKQGTSPWWRWWSWLWHRRQPVLPKPEEAVADVERFLKRQRSQ
ncbi:MAG TPA: hypothetical protein VFA10_06515 [Ktedonobacteraceae bacterium]|nr:hypothetical protein [Ktedonobacteraceae bacterium]